MAEPAMAGTMAASYLTMRGQKPLRTHSRANYSSKLLCHTPGVAPTRRKNTRVKWLWPAKPIANATSASGGRLTLTAESIAQIALANQPRNSHTSQHYAEAGKLQDSGAYLPRTVQQNWLRLTHGFRAPAGR
jgi:hypothetical protein